jgi:hypothetical protein
LETAVETQPIVEEPVVNEQPAVGGIFDNVASATPVAPTEPVVPVDPVIVAAPAEPTVVPTTPVVDVFGTPAEQSSVSQPTPVVANEPVVQQPSVVQAQAPSSTETQVVSNNTVTPETPVTATQAPVVEGPKPVDAAMLEGTIAFTPIPNHPNNPIAEEQADVLVKKKSKGFVNLAILLVVLVGVTIVSIELGKYLYSVFGAQ